MLQNNSESVAIHIEILYLFHSKRKFSDKSPFDFCVSYIFILCICKMQSTENWFGYLIKLKIMITFKVLVAVQRFAR